MNRRPALPALALLAATAAAVQQGGGFELPFLFEPGTPARANEVNASFAAVTAELLRLDDDGALAGAARGALEDALDRLDPGPRTLLVAPAGAPFSSVAAALESVEGASAQAPWLVQLAPGVYEESELCVVKPFVHLCGSGPGTTVIRGARSATTSSGDASLVELQDGARVSRLTVHNVGSGPDFTIGVRAVGCSPATVLEDVTVRVEGQGSFSSVFYGVELERGSLTLERCAIRVTGIDWITAAVRSFALDGDQARVQLRGCTLRAEGSGGLTVRGVKTDFELDGCDAFGGFTTLNLETGPSVARVSACRLEAGGPWAFSLASEPVAYLVAESLVSGGDPAGDPLAYKYVHCFTAAFDPIADGLGSDVGP